MDTTRALTEAAASYKTRQDVLVRQIQITSVAYTLLGKLVEGAHGDRILGARYGDMAPGARAVNRVPDAALAVRNAGRWGVTFSVTAVQTDFEGACRNLLSDALEFWEPCWTPVLLSAKPPSTPIAPLAKRGWAGTISEELRSQSADEGFLVSCYSLLNIKPTDKDLALLPVFDFFRRCRNRLIHQDGTAGSDLAEFVKSRKIRMAFNWLPASVKAMVPSLPEFEAADAIILTPQHAVLFLIVARELFNALASRIRAVLDEDGYLRMAAYYAYIPAHHSFREKNYTHVAHPAMHFLTYRYKLVEHDEPKAKVITQFRRLGLWDTIVARFHKLFPPLPVVKVSRRKHSAGASQRVRR
jgi:hypothetical protein